MDKWNILQHNLYLIITFEFLNILLYSLNTYMKLSTAIFLFYLERKKKVKKTHKLLAQNVNIAMLYLLYQT